MWRTSLLLLALAGCGDDGEGTDFAIVVDLAGDLSEPACTSVAQTAKNAAPCCLQSQFPPSIVCFSADDPQLYTEFVRNGYDDGGVPLGQCPTLRDILPLSNDCQRYACGPLLPSAARQIIDGGTATCCYALEWTCGASTGLR